MTDNKLLVGVRIVRASATEVARRPVEAVALVLAAIMTALVAPLWGATLTWLGWLETRERIGADGVISLGSTLAPQRARDQYRDGVWRGLWRVHGVSVAFAFVQAPVILLIMVPAAVVYVLFSTLGPIYPPGIASTVITFAVPVPVAIACLTIAAGEAVLAYRMLRAVRGPYSVGLMFRITGAAWQTTLGHVATLASLGITLALGVVVAGVVVGLLVFVADLLALGGGQMVITLWLAIFLGVLATAVELEAIASWAEGVTLPKIDETKCWSFTDWLWSWLGSVFGWFAKQGMVAVGTGACLVIGLLTGVVALATQQVFTSWVGLGWFTVTAAVLVTIRLAERKQ